MSHKFINIHPNKIQNIWLTIQPLLGDALLQFNTGVTLEELYDRLLSSQYFLVITLNESDKLCGVTICAVESYYNQKVFFVNLAVGTGMPEWKDAYVKFMIDGARKFGCKTIEWRGRPGFMKMFKDVAKIKHVSMVIEVESDNG
jgi:hypothetical protein